MIIAHPACNLEHVRLAFHEPAKTNTLDAAANNKLSCFLNRVIG